MNRGIFVLLLTSTLLGCGKNPLGRQQVGGSVTLDGKPVAQGSIGFEPQQPGGVGSGAMIRDGAYAIAESKGLPPGKYRVRISAADLGGEQQAGALSAPPGSAPPRARKNLIPPKYNSQSELTVEVVDGNNRFDFDLTSK